MTNKHNSRRSRRTTGVGNLPTKQNSRDTQVTQLFSCPFIDPIQRICTCTYGTQCILPDNWHTCTIYLLNRIWEGGKF
jgi:hypothetical protein